MVSSSTYYNSSTLVLIMWLAMASCFEINMNNGSTSTGIHVEGDENLVSVMVFVQISSDFDGLQWIVFQREDFLVPIAM
jgi:hypothetical protein